MRRGGAEFWVKLAGADKDGGFRIARELLGSRVQKIELSAYDLAPDNVGMFDVVVCGSLLLHLRDPVRALEAMRSVCSGDFMVTNQVTPAFALARRTPVAVFAGMTNRLQWWIPNPAANRQLVEAAGFTVVRETGVYAVPFGAGHAPLPRTLRGRIRRLARRVIAGGEGVPHHAVLAAPAA
jgi:tRNA (mo5U34)-methyltransferase